MIIDDHNKILFHHIRKTGGTSITDALIENTKSVGVGRKHGLLSDCSEETQEKVRSYYSFSFVRNPFERVVSWYNHLVFHIPTFWPENPPTTARGLCGLDFRKRASTFEKFIELMSSDEEMEPDMEFYRFRTPQKIILTDSQGNDPYSVFSTIGKLENVSMDWFVVSEQIKQHCGLVLPPLLIKNSRPRIRNSLKEYYQSKELIEIILAIHAEDFSYFHYGIPYELVLQ